VNKYHIRYNTQHGKSDLIWRVFENGQEHLIRDFRIETPVYGEATVENGIQKWNICCEGFMTVVDDTAHIKGTK
jgi:hypothetical protein